MADHTSPPDSPEGALAKRYIPYDRTFTETFDVLVGREQKQQLFTVHHKVITERSGFFRKARAPEWNSDTSLPVELYDADPETFDMYLYCVCHNEVPKFLQYEKDKKDEKDEKDEKDDENDESDEGDEGDANDENDREGEKDENDEKNENDDSDENYARSKDGRTDLRFDVCVNLYILADSLLDFATTKLVTKNFLKIAKHEKIPESDIINRAYRHTMADFGLRNALVEIYTRWAAGLPVAAPPNDFLRAMVERQFAIRDDDEDYAK
jgi:hypothetical protein